jgi:restriction system protein
VTGLTKGSFNKWYNSRPKKRGPSNRQEAMTLLACREYILPILQVLALHLEEGLTGAALAEAVAAATRLSATGRAATIQDGTPRYVVRIKMARYWLSKQGYVSEANDRRWCITPTGRKFLREGAAPSKLRRTSALSKPDRSELPDPAPEDSPQERIDAARKEIREALAAELLSELKKAAPAFFERAVLQLLAALGPTPARTRHTGGSGDGGIDGIIELDHLGLERVYVQAKRVAKNVGPADIRDFCGALGINKASKGVLLTTGTFTQQALDHAERAQQTIRLVNGQELASLMIDFGIGVSRAKVVTIPVIDRDFFEG